ncbi:hypothetical protein BN946_scf184354.g11 [Trametes cinnabarina]|uniref:F-box domain-containing protein n=1 Tax=Pycnoporus cinnabarinus TaxID=5643 RepID=A0A060SCK0_PYCCI|nr:hypothetical protein BN946_scf184354.g11 [Trametes cinnabarina]
MPQKLPQELVDQAIDHLWNDRASLRSCSRVCRRWLPSARTHLFRDQRLTSAKDCVRFEALVKSSPEVASYVRKLAISETMSSMHAQHWLNRIPALVAQLPRLSTLELIGVRYPSLQSSSSETLAALKRLTALVFADVYFDSYMDLHTLLSAACDIKDLCFYRVSWMHPSYSPASAHPSLPVRSQAPLRRLVIDSWASSTMLREWLLPTAEHLDVRTLMVRWRERDCMDVLNALLKCCGASLQNLYIELPTTMEESQELPSLYYSSGLRSLEIDGLVVPGCVAWTSALLANLRAPFLEKLSISLLLLNSSSLLSFNWANLDSVLSQPSFSGTTLKLNINLALHTSNDPNAVRESLSGYLPDVARRGKLSICCIG